MNIYWRVILNSKNEKDASKYLEKFGHIINTNISSTVFELYEKIPNTYLAEFKTPINCNKKDELFLYEIMKTINSVSKKWTLNLITISDNEIEFDGFSDNFKESYIYWVGISVY